MSSLGGQKVPGKLVTVQRELPDSVDGVVDAIRQIILLGEIQTLTVQIDKPIVYQRFIREGEEVRPEESTDGFAELDIMGIIRNVPMEEYEGGGEGGPCAAIMLIYHMMELERLSVTHLVVAEDTVFWDWVGIDQRTARKLPVFMGARVERTKDLPDDVFLVCGAQHRNATAAEIAYVLKSNVGLGVEDEGTQQEDS